MATPKAKASDSALQIEQLKTETVTLRIIGTTPLFQNRMAEKAKMTLLVGGGKKTASERKEIKHDPIAEFRSAAQFMQEGPTALGIPTTAIKGAMLTAALETAGVTKESAKRLLFMPGAYAALYGTPYLRLDIVRSADINKTPDVRSRPFLPIWGAEITIQYVKPQLNLRSTATLLSNAGVLVGVGDFRQEKGRGNFGSFRVLGEGQQDAEWDELVAHHGRKEQLAALNEPMYANEETRELMEAFFGEVSKRRAA